MPAAGELSTTLNNEKLIKQEFARLNQNYSSKSKWSSTEQHINHGWNIYFNGYIYFAVGHQKSMTNNITCFLEI